MAATALLDRTKLVISTAVDPGFYREVYPDLDAATHPASHYAQTGWREGRDPAPWFSTSAYLTAHPDVAESGENPLLHYLIAGRAQGREIASSAHAGAYYVARLRRRESADWTCGVAPPAPPASGAVGQALGPEAHAAVAEAFDADFYLESNPDVAAGGEDPLEHFLAGGWREGRDPSPGFSLSDYLEAYPDIAAAGVNPFVHYVTAGRAEGRIARLDLGFRYRLIAELVPADERAARAARAAAKVATGQGADLEAAFAESRAGWRDLHLTFSHDDFSANLGGVQVCLQREAARFEAMGRDHLHLFPATPWPALRAAGEPGPLGVWWNGRALGAFDAGTVARAVRTAAGAAPAGARSFAIHSLLGHQVDETIEIIEAAGLSAGFFWLHDFASLCAGVHLLRNDVADCGAPAPDSAACGICAYRPLRQRHLEEHERLFRRLQLTVVAPSEPTLATWRAGWRFPAAGVIVHPHARLVARTGEAPPLRDGQFRFAFVGLPESHKGWRHFRGLALRYGDDPRYVFLHLGVRTERGLPVEHHQVAVGESAPAAMQAALEAHSVDAAMVWPLCRETFSFTAYESAAAGAAVVTGPDTGNVAAFVRAAGCGQVMDDEAALDAAFASGEILRLSRSVRRPTLSDLAFSGMTADLVSGAAG